MKFSPLKAFYPTADDLLTADRDQFDETVLRHLKTYEGGGTVHQPVGGFNRDYYIHITEGTARGLGTLPTQPEYGERQPEVSSRMQEAWHRLLTKGYLMPNPDQPHSNWFLITTEGRELLSRLGRYEYWEKLGVDQVKADLEHTGGIRVVGGGPGVAQMAWDWLRMKQGQAMLPPVKRVGSNSGSSFVANSRIDELRKLTTSDFDFQKLIRLCEELNSSYDNENYYATAMLTRAVLDHVPPLFNHAKFAQVANNYSGGGQSFKHTMQHLEGAARKIADAHLHVHIRKRETLPTAQQVWCGQQLDVLLAEIIRISK